MKKVLIVSYHFPPLNSMAAKRYGYMCKYFRDNGYEPLVITSRARSGGFLDSKLDLPVPISKENIFRFGQLGIQYPIKDYRISLLLGHMNIKKRHSRIIDAESIGWYYKVKENINLEEYKDVDVVIGTFPAMGNIYVAQYIARKLGKPFIAEIRDLISDYSEGYDKGFWSEKIELFLEKCILSRADGIVAVTSGFTNILRERYPTKKITTIYNGWEIDRILPADFIKEDYLYYAGCLYEHRVESLNLLFNILKDRGIRTKVIIRSLGPDYLNEKLKKIINSLELEEQIIIKKASNENVVQREQNKAKINLLVSSVHKEDTALMTTLPGKLFELINVSSPVLAIVDDSAEIGEVLKRTNKGIASTDEKKIAEFIVEDHRNYKGNNLIFDYSRKKQAKKLCEFLNTVTGGI